MSELELLCEQLGLRVETRANRVEGESIGLYGRRWKTYREDVTLSLEGRQLTVTIGFGIAGYSGADVVSSIVTDIQLWELDYDEYMNEVGAPRQEDAVSSYRKWKSDRKRHQEFVAFLGEHLDRLTAAEH